VVVVYGAMDGGEHLRRVIGRVFSSASACLALTYVASEQGRYGLNSRSAMQSGRKVGGTSHRNRFPRPPERSPWPWIAPC